MTDQIEEYRFLYNLFKGEPPTCKVVAHCGSTSGLKYKYRVELPIRVKPKDRGAVVLNISNALYRLKGFKYALSPSLEHEGPGRKKVTVLYYFFNDTIEAVRLGYKMPEYMMRARVQHERREFNGASAMSAFRPPYLRLPREENK